MANEEEHRSELVENVWRTYLLTGAMPDFISTPWYKSRRLRKLYRHLPANPRCQVCYYPFKGIGGAIMHRFFGVVPSRLNPHLCNHCEQFAEKFQGGAEVEVTILFADVRGSTTLAEKMKPAEFSRLINRFYNAVTHVLYDTGAMVEKIIGDAVTGFYVPGFAGPEHAKIAVEAARMILRATGHEQPSGPWIPAGIGVHTGQAYVGAVSSDAGVSDIAILGDTANIGARLASLAAAGEIYLSRAAAQAAGQDPSAAEIRSQALKGRSEPIEVWVIPSRAGGAVRPT